MSDLFRIYSYSVPPFFFQDAAAQRCPVGLPGLQFVEDWRSWKAEEGDVVQGEEERCKVGTGGEKLPRRRQARLPQGCQDKILKHAGRVSCVSSNGEHFQNMLFSGFATTGSWKR